MVWNSGPGGAGRVIDDEKARRRRSGGGTRDAQGTLARPLVSAETNTASRAATVSIIWSMAIG